MLQVMLLMHETERGTSLGFELGILLWFYAFCWISKTCILLYCLACVKFWVLNNVLNFSRVWALIKFRRIVFNYYLSIYLIK